MLTAHEEQHEDMEQLLIPEHEDVWDAGQDCDETTISTSSGFRKVPTDLRTASKSGLVVVQKRCFLLNRVNNQMIGQGTKHAASTTLREP